MSFFPAQYSTLSKEALASYVAQQYDLPALTGRLLLHGVSDTYRLDSPAVSYIFKVYRSAHRSLEEIRGEVALLTLLREHQAQVSYPIADTTGELIQTFQAAEGIRYGVLFSFAAGKPYHFLSDEQHNILGREMARIHSVTHNLELPYPRPVFDIQTTLIRPLKNIAAYFTDLPDEYAYLTRMGTKVRNDLAMRDTTRFSYGYCHYDYFPKNFHFDDTNTFTLFDFDFAGKGFLVNDLVSYRIHLFFHEIYAGHPKETAEREFAQVVAAYRTIRPVSDEELALIPHLGFLFLVFYLGFQHDSYEDWSNLFFTKRHVKATVQSIQKFMNQYELFRE